MTDLWRPCRGHLAIRPGPAGALHEYADGVYKGAMTRPCRVAVAGATGYIGIQCVEILARHPHVELAHLLGRSHAGKAFREVVPGSAVDLTLEAGLDVTGVDAVLTALPHTVAASHARGWIEGGAVVVDMSADFRLRDPAAYPKVAEVSAVRGLTAPSPARSPRAAV